MPSWDSFSQWSVCEITGYFFFFCVWAVFPFRYRLTYLLAMTMAGALIRRFFCVAW